MSSLKDGERSVVASISDVIKLFFGVCGSFEEVTGGDEMGCCWL